MEKALLNILTPAYNCEKYISNLLNSILCQTYPLIEMYVIDDGSTDQTADIIRSYTKPFADKGYKLHYIYQKNQGQSAAINNGLKLLNGEFLVWPDSDDWYATPDALEKMVEKLSNTDDCVGILRCGYNRIDESTQSIVRLDLPHQEVLDKLFERNVTRVNNDVWLEPGGWMIKLKFLDKIIPNREIYHSKMTGQNTQILWPYFYCTYAIAIREPLFNYLIRSNSHSRNKFTDIEYKIEQQEEFYNTYCAVINGISQIKDGQKTYYYKCLETSKYKDLTWVALSYGNSIYYQKFYKLWRKSAINNNIPPSMTFIYYLSFIPFLFNFIYAIKSLKKFKNAVKN